MSRHHSYDPLSNACIFCGHLKPLIVDPDEPCPAESAVAAGTGSTLWFVVRWRNGYDEPEDVLAVYRRREDAEHSAFLAAIDNEADQTVTLVESAPQRSLPGPLDADPR